jgi:biopolymer transport protein ExbB/TolQ
MEAVTLSPWGLFMQAGLVVKGVMVILFAASIWCWVIIIESLVALRRLRVAIRAERAPGSETVATLLLPVFTAGADSLATPRETPSEARQRIADAMTRAARAIMADAERGLPNLAVISSVAPFIGLFGTVWGIMTSFAGIAEAKETSLAIVAPGIAEALAATAYGLAAAIPASIAYNRIGAAFGHCGQDIVDLIESRAATFISRNLARLAVE